MPDRDAIVAAIRECYSQRSCASPDGWSTDNPAFGQCEVASFVAWEHFGGDLVLGRVMLDGVQTEYHYWNRIDGVDVDLSKDQFRGAEVIEELSVLDSPSIRAQQDAMRPEVATRVAILRADVDALLARIEVAGA